MAAPRLGTTASLSHSAFSESSFKNFQLKTELTNDHLRKMLLMMVDEQNRTEELLTTSLSQLKKSHLLLVSYGNSSEEMSKEYQVLTTFFVFTK